MADNYLITGYHGAPHVTAENDRGIQAGIVGAGRFVLPVGEQFAAEYIGNNTIRMHDGKLIDNGAAAGIPAGEYIDLMISNAGQGNNRNDLIVFQYSKDASSLIETGSFVVVEGEETTGTAADPTIEQNDLLSGSASFDQMALWRVKVSGTTISAPEKLFDVSKSMLDLGDTDHTHANATTSKAGFMSAADKTKLNGIEAGANKTTVDVAVTEGGTNPVSGAAVVAYAQPKATASTDDLTAGTSPLATGEVYMVYE